ncbi:MAG: DAK2 domain-containing protein [Clostridia bacterium]|nr:DAK2 domain-containing protein [Clostridia bacterium]
MTKIIDASLLSKMIISGANNLSNNKELVDALNVFPVPDGDTGTNMSLTFMNAARSVDLENTADASVTAKTVAKATLRGARGNSGVILSQIFRGISKEITSSEINVKTMVAALQSGSDTAYRAVMKPTEGTILTVIRAAAETASRYKGNDIEGLMQAVYKGMNSALAKTQEMLPQLKQAGVVDAGGQGLVFIFEGFLAALSGNEIKLNDSAMMSVSETKSAQSTISTEDIKFAYCTEFIINKYDAKLSADKMRNAIEPKGDCMIVIDEDDIVKVHIHTNHPGFVLEQAVKLGEMVNIKIENMREQHTDILNSGADKQEIKPVNEHKDVAVVAVANGEGLVTTFKELGVTTIIFGGQTMNPSTEDILNAIEEANADTVFILPNNKNIVLAAEQASQISDCKAVVIPSKSIPQGICAMMEFSPDASLEDNTQNMTEAMERVVSGNVTHAVKDTQMDGIEIHEGNIIGVSGGHILSSEEDIFTSTVSLVEQIANEDSEIITLYYGEGETEESAQKIADAIEESFPDADILVANGGQSVYYYIVSVE